MKINAEATKSVIDGLATYEMYMKHCKTLESLVAYNEGARAVLDTALRLEAITFKQYLEYSKHRAQLFGAMVEQIC